jgi:hypothetical protein
MKKRQRVPIKPSQKKGYLKKMLMHVASVKKEV